MYSWYEVSRKGYRTAVRAKTAEDAKRDWCNIHGYLHEPPDIQVRRIDSNPESTATDAAPAGYTSIIW